MASLNSDLIRPPTPESLRTAATTAARDRVAHRLARKLAVWMLEARFPEGSRFPPEQELCAELGCSRMGLRSALRLLESWGLIAIQTGRNGGPVVRNPRVGDLRDALSVLMYAEHATLADVLISRRAIDPIIAAEAARRATPEQTEQMDAVLTRLRGGTTTQREFLAATSEFQSILASTSELAILGVFLRVLASFGEASLMQRMSLDDDWREQVTTYYQRIRDAVADHDSEGARSEMLSQKMASERHWQLRGDAFIHVPLTPFEFGE